MRAGLALSTAALLVAAPASGALPAAQVKLAGAGPVSAAPGGTVTLNATIKNGRKALKGYSLELLLSRDGKRDAKDRRAGRLVSLGSLKPRKTFKRTMRVALPASTPEGSLTILGCLRPKKVAKKTKLRCAALRIAVRNPGAVPAPVTPAPAPTATATPTPLPTATPSPTVTPTPTPDPGPGEPPAPGPRDPAPPAPEEVAPELPKTEAASLADAADFLYTGANAIQKDVEPNAIKERRVAVLRGSVATRAGNGIEGVRVTVADEPELGRTATRADGSFDIAVNGGGPITLVFEREGYIPAQRLVDTPWQDYTDVDPVVLVPYDDKGTVIDGSASAGVQVARGTTVTDGEGSRTATLLFDPGTSATMRVAGRRKAIDSRFTVRMTEYTQGAGGLDAMPGQLPPATAFTYAAEFSLDQAVEAGASEVTFSKPVVSYTDNFLEFPAGTPVPTGYYDRETERWVGSKNGIVLAIVGEADGRARLDVSGDGVADDGPTLAGFGIDDAELVKLASLYEPGKTLWRVEIGHFTPWDYNYPYGPGPDAASPDNPGPSGGNGSGDGSGNGGGPYDNECQEGSIVFCDAQVLGEALPIAGTPWSLVYRSDRVPGRIAERTLDIPLSGATVPASLKRIDLEVSVAGTTHTKSFDPAPKLSHRFTWDGRDGYGRVVQGSQPATIRVGFTYDAVYQQPGSFDSSWARLSGVPLTGNRARQEFTSWQTHKATIGGLDARGQGIGGWTLSIHDAYDPASKTLIAGDGTVRSVEASRINVLNRMAGTGSAGHSGDGGPASEARVDDPAGLVIAADGALVLADAGNDRIRRVTPGGEISTLAGNGQYGFSGDGGPARDATLSAPRGVAVDADGAVLVADTGANRVRRIALDGTITTIAGGGKPADALGDDGPATQARLAAPEGVAAGADGTIYVADSLHHRVRAIGTDGRITTVAGDGTAGFSGDGGPASESRLWHPSGLAVDVDGNLYVADRGNKRVRRIRIDGRIDTVAGGGSPEIGNGDGGPATDASLARPTGVAITPDGGLLIADAVDGRVRRVDGDGGIRTVAGGGRSTAEDVPAAAAKLAEPLGVASAPDGSLVVSDGSAASVLRIAPIMRGFGDGDLTIASEDGNRIEQFSPEGRHLRTLDAYTTATIREFAYDAAGRLERVGDADGTLLTIERDASGTPTALVARGGQRTRVTIGESGYLEGLTNPADETTRLSYGTGGLLTGEIDPEDGRHAFEYDALGRLTKDVGPAGYTQELELATTADSRTVTLEQSGGDVWTYRTESLPEGGVKRTVTDPSGGETITVNRPDGTTERTEPDGTRSVVRSMPDPRFGMQAPLIAEQTVVTPAGRTVTTTGSRTADVAPDGITLRSMVTRATESGRTTTITWDGSARTITTRTPAGRQSVVTLDERGRVIRQKASTAAEPVETTWDAQGRMATITQGRRSWTYAYDEGGRVASRTDAGGGVVGYGYDAVGRTTEIRTPTGKVFRRAYDGRGALESITTPLDNVHAFTTAPDGLGSGYTVPGDGGSYAKSFTERRTTATRTLPSGAVEQYAYDGGGRLIGTTTPDGVAAFSFAGATRLMSSARWTPAGGGEAQELAWEDDGALLPTSLAYSGVADGTFTYGADASLRASQIRLDAAGEQHTFAIQRDADSNVTAMGPYAIGRDPSSGLATEYAAGGTWVRVGRNGYGEADRRSAGAGSTTAFELTLERDDTGRVTRRQDTVGGGVPTVFEYLYDPRGGLTEVKRDGVVVEQYAYDDEGNRTSARYDGGAAEAAIYDAQQRLVQRGGVAYEYDDDGYLTRRGADAFTYGRGGELLSAQVNGSSVAYSYDALRRRVARTENGETTQYLYGNPDNEFELTASIDPQGDLTTYFYDEDGLLHAIEREGTRYRVATDQAGTPVAVMGADGAVVARYDRDAFGRALAGSDTAFDLEIGFGGGIADRVTGLVRLGLRDYDPDAGRFTAKDPLLFGGSPVNLYDYAGGDPVNYRDPTGLRCVSAQGFFGLGMGMSGCNDGENWSFCMEMGIGLGGGIEGDLFGQAESPGRAEVAEIAFNAAEAVGLSVATERAHCGPLKITVKGDVLGVSGGFSGDSDGEFKGIAPIVGKGALKALVKRTTKRCIGGSV